MLIEKITLDTRIIFISKLHSDFTIYLSHEFRYINSTFYDRLYKLKTDKLGIDWTTWVYKIAKEFGWSGRGYSPEFRDMKVFKDFLNACLLDVFPNCATEPELICL